ncbi:hypothetical protein LTR56_025993 [Elasticomyces elasticus]|nr:hypothetical protein LTR56_025993 [Elasticomyces elasticus]KAK3655343.1 hypothetical protein LTR22_010373 [Elasticomyces elasticus]KAK4918699.1 hypothetical protein LTR49_013624 [Elasticomyces elasticus]KAK5731937.1 hypothetical protein LTS12_027199 [Elasticomyces elasticus]
MLPSIRFIDHFAAINDNERSHDDSTQLAPVRSVEQPTARFYDDVRRDSVIHIPPVRYEKRNANTAHVGDSHDIIFQKMLNEHHDAQSPQRSPAVDRRTKLAIKSLLLAPPAAPLIDTTNTRRSPSSPASAIQDSPKKQLARKHVFRTKIKARAIYKTIFPQPKLPACPPSTEMLAPGTHLYADSKRWPNRGILDRSFINRLAVNDIDSFRPTPVIHTFSLLPLLQAVTAMTKQNKKIRRRCKGR